MASPTTTAQPDGRARAWRHARWAVDLICAVCLLGLAAHTRLAWVDLGIDVDWTWFVESANDLATGRAHRYVQFLYSSVPVVLFAGFIELVQDPMRLLRAWALLGALVAPLTYLAVRQVGGPIAGLAAGWVVAAQYDNVVTCTGIKSPYAIATWTALAMLGLAAASRRKPWGVPLLVLGTALAVGHHLGLWMMAPLVVVLACVHLARLPRPQAVGAGAAALLLGGAVLAVVLVFDLGRWLGELEEYRARFGESSSLGAGFGAFLELMLGQLPETHGERLLAGLAATTSSLRLLGGCVLAGTAALAARLGWLLWQRRAGAEPSHPQRPVLEAGLTGLQALALL